MVISFILMTSQTEKALILRRSLLERNGLKDAYCFLAMVEVIFFRFASDTSTVYETVHGTSPEVSKPYHSGKRLLCMLLCRCCN